ncbi:MAG: 2-oxoacid:acceptor oxidoreductase family protein [Rhodobacteraceae bacterium]|nr:2-oxoacid:acceptor oxidoreductase family protein [Paracoccaceae bacterium]
MLEIVILGRGGQGAQTAGNQLAQAYFAEGRFVQTFATYGGARRGTPVTSSIRVDETSIRLRCNIDNATALLCFDESLLDRDFLRLANSKTLIVVNSAKEKEAFAGVGAYRIFPVDGRAIARRNDMGKVVNSALLGAFAAALEHPGINTICDVIERSAPARKQQNIAACREAYQLFQTADQGV